MTNEEAIRIAQGLITDFKCESDTMVDFCNTIIKALKQSTWIPVSDRLPLLCNDVLVTNGYDCYFGYLVERKGRFFWRFYDLDIEVDIKGNDNDVTAWMSLPQPYKAEGSEGE